MIAKFRNLTLARSFTDKTEKPVAIVMGNDGYYWIVTLSEMTRLLKQGYETI